jgi:hypothetical protein
MTVETRRAAAAIAFALLVNTAAEASPGRMVLRPAQAASAGTPPAAPASRLHLEAGGGDVAPQPALAALGFFLAFVPGFGLGHLVIGDMTGFITYALFEGLPAALGAVFLPLGLSILGPGGMISWTAVFGGLAVFSLGLLCLGVAALAWVLSIIDFMVKTHFVPPAPAATDHASDGPMGARLPPVYANVLAFSF